MATAPRPGSTPSSPRREQADAMERQAYLVTYGSERYILAMADLGVEDDRLSRMAAGLAVSDVIMTGGKFGMDVIAILLWTARRKSGYKESYREFEQTLPSLAGMASMMEQGRLGVRPIQIDPTTGRPESPAGDSVPGEIAEGSDPLESGAH